MRRTMYALLVGGAALGIPLLLGGSAEAATPRTPSAPQVPSSLRNAPAPTSRPALRGGMLSLGTVSQEPTSAVEPSEPRREPRVVSTERPASASEPRRAGAHGHGAVGQRIASAWPGDDREALRIASCESSLNPAASSRSGRYRGLFQFDDATWRSVGGSGSPSRASVEEQTRRAWRLKQRRGSAPWPNCGGS